MELPVCTPMSRTACLNVGDRALPLILRSDVELILLGGAQLYARPDAEGRLT